MVYALILLPLLVAVGLYVYYFTAKDSHFSRSNLPIALILAVLTNLLLIIWILVYICCIYPRHDIFVNRYDRDTEVHDLDEGADDKKYKYSRQSKTYYIIAHCLAPVLNAIVFILFFFVTRDWVERHKG
mgnify:CR=1 FL=1